MMGGGGQKLKCLAKLSSKGCILFCACSRAVCCHNSVLLIIVAYPGLSQSSGEKYHYERYSEIS